jgi:integrase/recombinase XerD
MHDSRQYDLPMPSLDIRHYPEKRGLMATFRLQKSGGQDPAREMIKLTTYLGHTKPENTYWYIEAVPELLELAAQRVTGVSDMGACR